MENKKINSVMQNIDLEIVSSYNQHKNQVMLYIDPRVFNQIAEELNA